MVDWWQDWSGECVAIIGGGASVKKLDINALKDRIHVIAINEAFQIAPFAEIIYSAESVWWSLRWKDVKKHRGIKLSCELFEHVPNRVRVMWAKPKETYSMKMHFERNGDLGHGGNSGFQMVNLSAQFGAAGIALFGFDMNCLNGRHWHKDHPPPLRNPTYDRFDEWIKAMNEAAPILASRGIDVVNCSPTSSISAFPKVTIEEMLQRWGL